MLSREAATTNVIVFGLTQPEPEHWIHHIPGQHTNHYSTNAVQKNSENGSAIDIDGKVWVFFLCEK
jgi:hypothetical protein